MTLGDKVKINTHYTRSVNLERDIESKGAIDTYIPTSRALDILSRVVETIHDKAASRAWALVGPYGSGKSSLALFMSHLFGNPERVINKSALLTLKKTDAVLARKFSDHVKASSGYCTILLTGSPEPLAKRFTEALAQGAVLFWESKRGRTPAIVAKLEKLALAKAPSISEIIDVIKELQKSVADAGGKGIYVVFDELGKFLEYEARHYGANDIFLLQALAEHAGAGHEANLFVFVLLHQAFEQYARGLGETVKNEWAKVQGRFENVPFLESVEQTLRVVSAAFEHKLSESEHKVIVQQIAKVVRVLEAQDALPGMLDAENAKTLFSTCYPLHPVSAVLLPLLCQKVAQNERTLFSYLGSGEAHGFKDSLLRLSKVGEWIYPWEIYEYFILNQPSAVSDHSTHRRWAEVVTAIQRLGDATLEEILLLKTIGLLNIVGAQGGFKASKDLVALCAPNAQSLPSVAKKLVDKSVIQFRKFSSEYRVWQGSDFDLDAAVHEEVRQLGQYHLAEELNKRKSLLPIVARKYTIQTGTLRYFQPVFVDAQSYHVVAKKDTTPRILFYLAEGSADEKTFTKQVSGYFSDLDITVLCPNGRQIREVVVEMLALERVRVSRQELNADPVAQREFHDRLAVATQKQDQLLLGLTEIPENNLWYWRGKKLHIRHKRSLQHQLSEILQEVYHASPILQSELINRDSPSSQAVAARNKLLAAMLNHEAEENLGIEKYPPEKAIYRALLWATRIHRKNKEVWYFAAPIADTDKCNLLPVWKRIDAFFAESEKQPLPFSKLNEVLATPPYGVKAGVLPILYVASYLLNQQELALYENGVFRPYLTLEHLELFVRYPERYAIQRFRIEGLRASLVDEYAKLINTGSKRGNTLISLARPLAKLMAELPDYTKNTQRLSEESRKVRAAFSIANSPAQLLFKELPLAVGFNEITTDSHKKANLEGFAEKLVGSLRELKNAHSQLADRMRTRFGQAFNIDRKLGLEEFRNRLRAQCAPLDKYTIDVDGLKEFIRRASNTLGNNDLWFEQLLAFLVNKPISRWTDTDEDEAEFRLAEFSRRLLDLKKLYLYYEEDKNHLSGDFEVLLLKSIRQGRGEYERLVTIDEKRTQVIKAVKTEAAEVLNQLKDPDLRFAALAELVDEFLESSVTRGKREKPVRHSKVKTNG